MRIRLIPLSIFFIFSIAVIAQTDHWESVILPGDSWNYQIPTAQPSVEWTQLNFDDSQWESGPTGIGYGDGDDQTIIETSLVVYMRHQFEVITLADVEQVVLDMDYDDGFVAYLNGTEIARSLVSGDPPAFDQASDGLHEALLYNGSDPERWEVDQSLLLDGANILAVEVHNESLTSSDMTSIPILSLGINTTSNNYRAVPDWFDEPVFMEEVILETSNLPIVIINTEGGQSIPNEPKIGASMIIIDNGEGMQNAVTDVSNPESIDFDGAIQIEIRGATSNCCFDKKQYALTTYDEVGEKDNVSLLSMPKENDWILNGFAFDPSLMRDYISYQLSLKMGQYASRGRYCEVILNGNYQGLYVLQEKLKADDNRIDINKIDPDDNEGKSLTGGYITKSDKTEGIDVAAWYMDNYNGWQTAFIHEHPKPDEVTSLQNQYIQDVFFDLEREASAHDADLENGYPAIIDLPSFIDFMIVNELASNADAYQYSTYFHKDRAGKLRAGPVWDFNLTYGNDLFSWGFDRSHTYVWQFDDGDNMGAKFWRDLYEDPTFKCYLSKRWLELTAPGQPLHPSEINTLIDQVHDNTKEAVARNYARWGISDDYEQHLVAMKRWIYDRVSWMTIQMDNGQNCFGESVPKLVINRINYHPMTEDGDGEKDLEFIEITNAGSSTVDLTGIYIGGTGLVYQFPANSLLEAGNSVFLANETDAFKEAYQFLPFDEFSRSLNNGGQTISLLNGFGMLIDEVTYSDEAPWPIEADGEGYFLVLTDLDTDNNDAANWDIENTLPYITLSNVSDPVVSVYPNPTNERVQINSFSSLESVMLYDLSGSLIKELKAQHNSLSLDLQHLERGIYILHIRTDKQSYKRKLIIE